MEGFAVTRRLKAFINILPFSLFEANLLFDMALCSSFLWYENKYNLDFVLAKIQNHTKTIPVNRSFEMAFYFANEYDLENENEFFQNFFAVPSSPIQCITYCSRTNLIAEATGGKDNASFHRR